MNSGSQPRLRVLLVAPDPRDPGGITAVIESWRRAGLGDLVELTELPTSAMGSGLPAKLAQAGRATLALVRTLIGRSRPDLVHLHASTGGSLLRKLVLAYCCRAARVPYVAHEHSGELGEWIGGSRPRRAAAASLYGNAALVIVLGERWRALMDSLGAGRVEVLANGISAAERERLARAEAIRADRGDRTGGARLLFYGRWAAKKGPDRFAGALRALGRSDYELRVYGSGERGWIADVFEGVAGPVTIGGWLGEADKPAELGWADALIAPSRGEGLPMGLVEARAAGTPVIATDVGAVADALAGYERGLLLDADDDAGLRAALEEVLDGRWPPPSEPAELPPSLRSEVAVERLAGLYRSVLGR